jgi:hypothetical protein
VDLREAESIGAVDDDGVRGGNVDPALDDGGADQHVEAAMIEVQHELLEVALAHLAVPDGHAGLRYELADRLGGLLDGLDRVVHEIDLAAAAYFAGQCLAHDGLVPFQHEGLHGQPLGGRGGDQ